MTAPAATSLIVVVFLIVCLGAWIIAELICDAIGRRSDIRRRNRKD